ncbi:MAG: DNA polymerase III subunit chi [Gammaproteobacteria bacterium]
MSGPRVDFYILAAAGEDARRRFACRLAEKAYRLDHSVHLHADDAATVDALDELLWTFRDASFLPHEKMPNSGGAPVTIGCGEDAPEVTDLLINLCRGVPDFASRMPRIAELVGGDERTRKEGRRRFIFYRDKGYPLETHDIG